MQDALYLNSLFGEILKMFEDQEKKVNVSIEREETKPKDWVKETEPRMKKQRRENRGIIVTVDNFLAPTIICIQALPFNKLPAEYLSATRLPKVWQEGNKLLAGDNHILLQEGITYTRGRMTRALLYIELAGEHLAKVKRGRDRRWYNSSTATFKDGKLKSQTP